MNQERSIPFDQYQRYSFVRRAVDALAAGNKLKILEVGAAASPLRKFLPEQEIWFTDATADPTNLDLRASGTMLPFPGQTFPVVVSVDVLEHKQPENRRRFLQEIHRVSSEVLILGFPH